MGQSLDGLSFSFCSTLCPCIFDRRNSGLIFVRWVDGNIPKPEVVPIHWMWSLQVLSPLCWVFWLPVGSWESVGVPGMWDFLVVNPSSLPLLLYTYFQIPDPLYFLISSHIWTALPLSLFFMDIYIYMVSSLQSLSGHKCGQHLYGDLWRAGQKQLDLEILKQIWSLGNWSEVY